MTTRDETNAAIDQLLVLIGVLMLAHWFFR